MKYDYEKHRDYQIEYQKTSEKAKEARKRYYEKNKHKWKVYSKQYRQADDYQVRQLLTAAKCRAKKKGLPFDLTIEDIVIPDVCPVLGIPLTKGLTKTSHDSPSVDRIDNTKGYTKDNIKVISHRANFLKGDTSIEELKKILDYMSYYLN